MRALVVVSLAVVVCGTAVACNGDDAKDFVPGPGPILTGTNLVPPTVEGTWVLAATPAASGCGALGVLYPTESVLTIAQAGNDLEYTLEDGCGRPLPAGSGRVEVGDTITLVSESDRPLTPTCALRIRQAVNGLVGKPPNDFAGSDVLTIAGSDAPGLDQCDPTLPCVVSGSFTATRCPRTGCAVTCAP